MQVVYAVYLYPCQTQCHHDSGNKPVSKALYRVYYNSVLMQVFSGYNR